MPQQLLQIPADTKETHSQPLQLEYPMETARFPIDCPIRILAEFPGLLVVSKPSGIPFHRVRMHTNTDSDLSSEDDNTISDGEEDDGEELIANMEETFQRSGLEGEEAEEEEESGQRPTSYEDGMMQHLHRLQEEGLIRHQGKLYPIHRLDRVTSGLLLVGTTAESTAALGKAFENHKVQKYYVAISDRWPKKTMGTVSGDMKRSRRSAWMLLRSKVRPAVTKFISTKINKDLRAFLVKPETGRTHQIRVALKSVGAPCLGDSLSVNSSELKTFLNEYGDSERAAASDRTYLHACGLRIDLPQDGGAVKYEKINKMTLQLVLRPTDGHIFQTQEFADAWESYLVPAMMRDAVVTDGSSGHEGDRSPSPSISSPPRHLARFDVNDDLGPILKF
eukprot:jgi/Bigna1/132608/aug1.18_g7316